MGENRRRSQDIDPGNDELDFIADFIMDKYVNHGLDKILKEVQVIRIEDPENYGEYPGIRIYGGQWVGSRIAQEPDEDGDFIDILQKTFGLEIYVMQNQEVKYNGKVYSGVRVLTLIRDILIRVFSENDNYPEKGDVKNRTKYHDIRSDYIVPQYETWVNNYLGQPDAIALVLGMLISYEKKRL